MDELDFGTTIKGFLPGQKVLGRYKLDRILGRGGMGVVWLARDEELDRDVALKFLPEVVALDAEAVVDLKRETRRNLDLTHAHIVRIHDFVSDKRTAAIAMEYVKGASLAALKLERPGRVFPVAELRPWVEQLLEALHYAHTKAKVVHRDLKPANLMLTDAGDLKITDFGIATSITDSVSRVSKQAGASGTPVYMSPQQMMGEKAAVTDDIYAVGATLYELLTGKPPFYSGNVIVQVQSKVAPPIAERRAELGVEGDPVPPEWEQAIASCLAKDSAERPQSAKELAKRLSAPVSAPTRSTPIKTPPAAAASPVTDKRPGKSERAVLWVGLAMVAVAAAALTYRYGFLLPAQEEARRAAQELLDKDERLKRQKDEANRAVEKPVALPGQRLIVADLGLEMLPIAAGTFRMGTDSADDDLNLAKPVTQVTISKPFWLGRTEVTQQQWQTLMGANPSKFTAPAKPVESITWEQAMEFCDKLTTRERAAGRLPAGYVYRLPTEAQWEYACRSGTTGHHAGDSDAMGWNQNNSSRSTQQVGQKQANAWGLHDMHGNVAEWCLDFKHGQYPGGAVTDFVSQGVARTKRGGSWNDHPISTASWARAYVAFDPSDEFTGLRVALVPDVPLPQPKEESPAVVTAQQPRAGQPWENSLGQRFVPVPGTNVLFCIWETRVQDFEAFVKETGHDATQGMYSDQGDGWKQQGDTWRSPGFPQGPTHPVVGVNQADAKAFCEWLTKRERAAGRLGPDQSYRLPTDAEWDAAVGKAEFPWGNQWPPPRGAGNYADEAAKRGRYKTWTIISGYDDGYDATAPVGSFTANAHGIYDFGGNVWERVGDRQHGLRDASFRGRDRELLASSYRNSYGDRSYDIGFRVVCAIGSVARVQVSAAAKPVIGAKWTIPDLHLDLIPIAPGTFRMGSISGGNDDERPVTSVTITRPFWMGKTEVTQAQWSTVMGSNPSSFIDDSMPVGHVRWDEAMEFCRKLTERERAAGRLPEGYAYTLPTEAQWEYACRAGTTGDHAGDPARLAWSHENSRGNIRPTGMKQANNWGLHDMHGNMGEWVLDRYHYPGGNVTDPIGELTGTSRVYRGGSVNNGVAGCRSAVRHWAVPEFHGDNVGLRLALVADRAR